VQPLLQWKTVSITYSECVFVALVFRHAVRMRRNVICDLPRSTIFFNITSWKTQFLKGGGEVI
jgi:hypothetical protein